MTKPGYTHYAILVDRTGSMKRIAAETEAGIAQYIREQAELEGEATITLYEFDSWLTEARDSMRTQVNTIYDFAPIGIMLPTYKLVPRGNTPLLDAIGITVTRTGEKLAAMPEEERPELIIFTIVTDGGENDSREWDNEQVKALTEQQREKYGWRFTYLGANQDAFATASTIGVPMAAAANYSATHGGTQSAWSAASRWAGSTRTAGPGGQSVGYTQAERDAAKEK